MICSRLLVAAIALCLGSTMFPGFALAGAHLVGELNGAQEVPPVAVPGTGTVHVELNDTFDALAFDITVTGLTGPITMAHFHNAAIGVNGGIVRTITADFVGNTARGIWKSTDAEPLTAALVAQLLAGRIYVNIHTAAHNAGEIRGQLGLRSGILFRARLDGGQEVPPVATPATGTGSCVLTASGLVYDITVHGLIGNINNAHFHEAAPGVNGGVLQDILPSFTGNTATGTWAVTPTHIQRLLGGTVYVNVHTTSFGNGEIRGQLEAQRGSGFSAILDGTQEVPPSGSSGTGTLAATLLSTPGGFELTYHVTATGLTGTINNAHFHNAATGVNGGVVRTILTSFSGQTAAGVWSSADAEPLTAALVAELLAGRIYVNIHTTAVGSGEIRGQLRLKNGPSFVARMSGDQEVPPVTTASEGTGAFTLTEAGLRFSITYDALSSAFASAHIHQAPLGAIGGVVRDLSAAFAAGSASGTWSPADGQPLSPTRIRDLMAGLLYVNVHSANFGNGEVRGQLGDYAVTGVRLDPIGGPGPVLLPAYPNPFRGATTVRYELQEPTPVRLRLLDVQGRTVAVLARGVEDGAREIQVSGDRLTPGVYFLHLEAGETTVSRKLIRLR